MENRFLSKYHRQNPIRDFSAHQTMYDLVMSINADNMDYSYAMYFGKKYPFSQLKSETDTLAAALYHDGVRKNTIVGVCLLTVPEVDSVLLAINKIGAISYWLDASLKPVDMLHYLEVCQLTVLIVHETLLPVIAQISSSLSLKRIIVVPADKALGFPDLIHSMTDSRIVSISDYRSDSLEDVSPVEYEDGKAAVIVQSSGSTGMPKSIVHTDYNFNAAVKKMAYCDLPFYIGQRALVCAPPWIIYGLVNSIYSGLVFGITTVFTTLPEENMIYKHLGEFDFIYGVPVYYRYLYNKMQELALAGEIGKAELKRICSTLRQVSVFISGGDKVAENELINWQIEFDVPIINGYGNNEVTGAAIVSPRFANRLGSIGIPMYGTIVKTFDPDNGQMLPDGEVGELYIGGDTIFTEYLDNREATQNIKYTASGIEWVKTGDLAYIDSDGYIFLRGRTRRLIIDKLGYKISPDNSENYIQSFPFVRECVVVGVEVAENDTVPMAFIELESQREGIESLLDTIKSGCRENLKDYECPKFFEIIDKIPHKDNGGKQDFLALEKLAKEFVTKQQNIL